MQKKISIYDNKSNSIEALLITCDRCLTCFLDIKSIEEVNDRKSYCWYCSNELNLIDDHIYKKHYSKNQILAYTTVSNSEEKIIDHHIVNSKLHM